MTIFFASLLLAAAQTAAPDIGNPALRNELLEMQSHDQALRKATPVDVKAVVASDARHTARMRQVLAGHGWPSQELVGADGAAAAWLLVQHADGARDFQLAALALMEPLLASGEVKRPNYAYLWDRTHQPQRYGTQGSCVSKGEWKPDAIESPEFVEARRREMEMEPLADYVAMASNFLCGRSSLAAAAPVPSHVTPERLKQLYAAPSPFESVPRKKWIAESDNVFVIQAKNPQAPVHLLIIPKKRIPSLLQAPDALVGEMIGLAKRVAHDKGISQDGFRLIINTHPYGGQSVYHLHMHLVGGRELGWSPGLREEG